VATAVGDIVAAAGPASGAVTVSIRPELISIFARGDGNGGNDAAAGTGAGGSAPASSATGIRWASGFVAAGRRAGVNRLIGTLVEDTFLGQSSEHLVAVGIGHLSVLSAPPQYGLKGDVAMEFAPRDVVVLQR
jgi:hypothetical protein